MRTQNATIKIKSRTVAFIIILFVSLFLLWNINSKIFEASKQTNKNSAVNTSTHNRKLGESDEKPKKEVNLTINPFFEICKPQNGQESKEKLVRYFGNCLPPFGNFLTRLRIAKNYELAYCMNEKGMSSILRELICFLNKPEEYKAGNYSIVENGGISTIICNGTEVIEFYDQVLPITTTILENQNLTLFTVVRDPIQRFISAFVDKCINEKSIRPGNCYNCETISCLIDRQLERISNDFSSKNNNMPLWNYEDLHFLPQNWGCNFRHDFSRYKIFHYNSTTVTSIIELLREKKIPEELLQRILNQLKEAWTQHSTRNSALRSKFEKELENDITLKRKLIQMFYFDYVLFNFDIPSI